MRRCYPRPRRVKPDLRDDQVDVLLRDHHPAYVSWERHLTIRAALQDNSTQFKPSRGAPRRGGGVLQGLVVCGRCGCRMRLHKRAPKWR